LATDINPPRSAMLAAVRSRVSDPAVAVLFAGLLAGSALITRGSVLAWAAAGLLAGFSLSGST
jgi:hypothetical protein